MNDLLCGGERSLIANGELRALVHIHCPRFIDQLPKTTRHQRAVLLELLRERDRNFEPLPAPTRADYWSQKADIADHEREAAAWRVVAARIQLHRTRAAYLNLTEWW